MAKKKTNNTGVVSLSPVRDAPTIVEKPKKTEMIGWYFAPQNGRLKFGDNRPIVEGETHSVEGDLKICQSGLHAGTTPSYALPFGTGTELWQVRLTNEEGFPEDGSYWNMFYSGGKVAGRTRTYLKKVNVYPAMVQRALDRVRVEMKDWTDAPQIVKDFLDQKGISPDLVLDNLTWTPPPAPEKVSEDENFKYWSVSGDTPYQKWRSAANATIGTIEMVRGLCHLIQDGPGYAAMMRFRHECNGDGSDFNQLVYDLFGYTPEETVD